MIRTSFRAMGTTVAVHTSDGNDRRARQMFGAYEQRFSRFIADSELSIINRSTDRRITVSDELAAVLVLASEIRDRTDGLVDVGVGGAVVSWGYRTTFVDMTDLPDIPDPTAAPSWTVDGNVLRRARGTIFDLGGIAKGWTADQAVEAGAAIIASAGGDLRSREPSLVVEVVDDDDTVAASVAVGAGALATSSITRRTWNAGPVKAHHLIDPRTMAPASTPILSATVVADTAAEAEAGAKAVALIGADGLAWADRQEWIRGAVVIWHDGSVYGTTEAKAS